MASEQARFSLLFVRHGLALDCGASWLLPRKVGPQKAAELALLGEWVDAPEALRIGLVNKVVPTDDLLGAAHTVGRPARRAQPARRHHHQALAAPGH